MLIGAFFLEAISGRLLSLEKRDIRLPLELPDSGLGSPRRLGIMLVLLPGVTPLALLFDKFIER